MTLLMASVIRVMLQCLAAMVCMVSSECGAAEEGRKEGITWIFHIRDMLSRI